LFEAHFYTSFSFQDLPKKIDLKYKKTSKINYIFIATSYVFDSMLYQHKILSFCTLFALEEDYVLD